MDIFGIDKENRNDTITCGPRKKYRPSQDSIYDKMLKEKWDSSLEKGLAEGKDTKHTRKGPRFA